MQKATLKDAPYISPVASDDEFKMARKKGWLGSSERGYEVLSYDNAYAILSSKEVDIGGGFGHTLDQMGVKDTPIRDEWDKFIICIDRGEQRDRLRAALLRLLRPQQVAKLQPVVRELINEILDDIGDLSDVDFLKQFAHRIPSRLFCKLVSAPLEQEREILETSAKILSPILLGDKSGLEESEKCYYQAIAFMRENIQARRNNLTDDFTSEIIRLELEGMIRPDEVEAIGVTLMLASMDNTMNQIALTFGTLLEDRARWEMVLGKPSASTKAAEETFRMCPRFNHVYRHNPTELEIDGAVIPAGSWLHVPTRSCGRDEKKFDQPDTFRIDRPATPAMQFGSDGYSCVGATLARLEISEAIRIVAERFPNIRMLGDWEYEVTDQISECVKLRVSLV